MVLTRFFGTDVWVGEVSLRDKFSSLYELSILKGESMFAISSLGWGLEGAARLVCVGGGAVRGT